MLMADAKPKIRMKKTATKGEVLSVKVMVKHPMENGRRRNKSTGKIKPRLIINKFVCAYNDREAFVADMNTSVSANPYFLFYLRAKESGEIKFTWTDDRGESATISHRLDVK